MLTCWWVLCNTTIQWKVHLFWSFHVTFPGKTHLLYVWFFSFPWLDPWLTNVADSTRWLKPRHENEPQILHKCHRYQFQYLHNTLSLAVTQWRFFEWWWKNSNEHQVKSHLFGGFWYIPSRISSQQEQVWMVRWEFACTGTVFFQRFYWWF